jgi:hypothetical protein
VDQLAKDMPQQIKVEKLADGKVYDISEFLGGTMFVGIVDANTAVASPWKDQVEDALAKGAGKKKTQLKDREMNALLEKMDPKQAVAWAACREMVWSTSYNFAPNAFVVEHKFLEDLGVASIVGGLTIEKDVTGQMTLVAKDADAAKAILAAAEGGLQGLRNEFRLAPLLKAVKLTKVSTKESTITFQGQTTGGAIGKAIMLLLGEAVPKK